MRDGNVGVDLEALQGSLGAKGLGRSSCRIEARLELGVGATLIRP